MATGILPFKGETSAVIFEAILNRDPQSVQELNSSLPPAFATIIEKALEKDRSLRYQNISKLKTDFMRLKKKLESGGHNAARSRCGVISSPDRRKMVGRGALLETSAI